MKALSVVLCAILIAEPKQINGDIHWLEAIEFPTRTNQMIDISLPRLDHKEECFIRKSDESYIEASKVEGVKVYNSSYFVSCRIKIGPMVTGLIGEWVLCGIYTESNEEHMRCLPAEIYWNRQDHAEEFWLTNVQTKYFHPVNFASTLTVTVTGFGEVVACHIITPGGEDLVIGQESKYPSITVTSFNSNICSFTIGPLHEFLLGDWVIYGLFNNLIQALNEVRRPFKLFSYDKEHPFNQAYYTTVLDTETRAVDLGIISDLEVGVDAGQVDSCYFKTPFNDVYDTRNENKFEGASFVKGNNGSVVCRVAVGPITKRLLGDWNITGKFSNNGIFNERQQIFHLVETDTAGDTEITAPTEKHEFILNVSNFRESDSAVNTEITAPTEKHKFIFNDRELGTARDTKKHDSTTAKEQEPIGNSRNVVSIVGYVILGLLLLALILGVLFGLKKNREWISLRT